jgi:hypothetical protein
MAYTRSLFLPAGCVMSPKQFADIVSKTFRRDQSARIVLDIRPSIAWVKITWGDWSLRVLYARGPETLEESREIAELYGGNRPDKESLAACDQRIEISSDKDYPMTHFHHFTYLLQDLEEQVGGVLFVPEDEAFFDQGEFN